MSNDLTTVLACMGAGLLLILYKIWGCLEDIAGHLDQSKRIDELEKKLQNKPLEGDEWKSL